MVARMDREMTKHGRTEIITEDAASAVRRAVKWAQMGLVVSTGPPVDTAAGENAAGNSSGGSGGGSSVGVDKKKTATEVVCKEKNAELAR